jgi:hypothetical protein
LCRAVEFELAGVLAGIPVIGALDKKPLGDKAYALMEARTNVDLRARLKRLRMSAGYLLDTLPAQLLGLARIRSATQAVHGGLKPRNATREDSDRAFQIALGTPSAIIPSLAKERSTRT